MEKIITQIDYNFRLASDGYHTIDVVDSYFLGSQNVVEIIEHPAMGEGDKWFWTVIFENGDEHILFNVNKIYKKIKP